MSPCTEDGAYVCSYVVPSRGDYSVSVSLNGPPIHGSPFPVFFSSAPGGFPGTAPGAGGAPGGANLQQAVQALGDGICKDYLNGRCQRVGCKFSHAIPSGFVDPNPAPGAAATAAVGAIPGTVPGVLPGTLGVIAGGGVAAAHAVAAAMAAAAAGAGGADAAKEMQRTLHVGNLSPLAGAYTRPLLSST
jgi:hypothetical protein